MKLAISSNSEEKSSYNVKEQDRILKNSNIYKQKANSHLNCLKHPNKKLNIIPKMIIEHFFCSKCALNLALKSHEIEENAVAELEFQRQMRINQFQETKKQAVLVCNSKILGLNNLQISQKQKLEDQNTVKFFEQVIETAHQLNKLIYKSFKMIHSSLEQNKLDYQQAVTNNEKQLQQYQIDISKIQCKDKRSEQEVFNNYQLKSGVKINQFEISSFLTFYEQQCATIFC
ncbi:unnamed protein product [Paramecium primaurelia]|uniref:Uncharacterized protein n=1 Tax=Paramecium primaurelia TaxID=5886 RepID=A0A8S1MNQ0_PARPR|nr:unnamed protein product [Paramecium primaurelia]